MKCRFVCCIVSCWLAWFGFATVGRGRVIACETLITTPAIRNHIRERKEHVLYSEMQTGRKFQMQTMDAALLELYQKGEITYDITSHAREPGFIRHRTGEAKNLIIR